MSQNPTVKAAQLRLQQLALALPVRNDLHIARKIWHAGMGLMIISIFTAGIPKALALELLAFFFFLDVGLETLRLRNPVFNEKCVRFFGMILRNHELNRYSTVPYYLAAVFFSIAVFPKPVAVLAMLYLALGDPAASFFGVLFKKHSIKIFQNKSMHGSLGAFAVCALATYVYLRAGDLQGLALIRLTLLGGFAGAVAEALPLEIDDNFSIPVVSGFIMWAGFLLIHFV